MSDSKCFSQDLKRVLLGGIAGEKLRMLLPTGIDIVGPANVPDQIHIIIEFGKVQSSPCVCNKPLLHIYAGPGSAAGLHNTAREPLHRVGRLPQRSTGGRGVFLRSIAGI